MVRGDAEKSLDKIMCMLRAGQLKSGVELLYNHHYNKIYGIAFSIVKNEVASEDIVHCVAVKLLQLDKEKFPIKFESAWLYSVVKNEALMYLRKNKREVRIDSIVPASLHDKSIDDFVNMDCYYSMIKDLNEKQKEIVTLKVLGGFTHREIAEMVGKPTGTVQWIYNTAIKKLRYVLSSLLGLSLIFCGLFIYYITQFVDFFYGEPETGTLGGKPDFIAIADWRPLVVFGVLFAVSLSAFLIIYIFSYNIPTKAAKK